MVLTGALFGHKGQDRGRDIFESGHPVTLAGLDPRTGQHERNPQARIRDIGTMLEEQAPLAHGLSVICRKHHERIASAQGFQTVEKGPDRMIDKGDLGIVEGRTLVEDRLRHPIAIRK